MDTAENQKIVIVNKATTDKKHPYTPINIEVLNSALTTLKGNEFKVWMYIAKNQNQFTFALSSKETCRICNICRSTYVSAIHALLDKGYLVPKADEKNVYIFYEAGSNDPDATIKISENKKAEIDSFQF